MKHCRHRIVLLVAFACLWSAALALAHPLGNNTVSHFDILYVLPDRCELDLLLDFAEIPTARIQKEMDTNEDGGITHREQRVWLDHLAETLPEDLVLRIDGQRYAFKAPDEAWDPERDLKEPQSRGILEVPGTLGLPQYRATIRFVAEYDRPLEPGTHTVKYVNRSYPDAPGLKRILLLPNPAVEFHPPRPEFWNEGGVNTMDWSRYDPAHLPNEREAEFKIDIVPETATQPAPSGEPESGTTGTAGGDAAASGAARSEFETSAHRKGADTLKADKIMGLVAEGRWGLTVFLLITGLSFVYGAGHALMPGHAKTIVAAYLISQKGTYWHAVVLAFVVTITHTLLVVVLGLVIAWAGSDVGQTAQIWLGIVSGLLVAGMGAFLAFRALTGRLGHHHDDHDHHHHHDDLPWYRRLLTHSHPHVEHAHDRSHDHAHEHHDHDHPHHDHDHAHSHGHPHDHGHDRRGTDPSQQLTLKTLLVLGVTGGIVPCPTATIIMLLGISSGAVIGALYAVGVFSLGLALTLMMVGFVALSSRRIAARIMSDAAGEGELSGGGRRLLLQVLPTASGAVVVALGLLIAANYAWILWAGESLVPWLA